MMTLLLKPLLFSNLDNKRPLDPYFLASKGLVIEKKGKSPRMEHKIWIEMERSYRCLIWGVY